jgi:hypothetical protein
VLPAAGDPAVLRRGIRQHGMGYVMAVRASHLLTTGPGRTVTAAAAARLIPANAGHQMRTGSGIREPVTTTGRCWRQPATLTDGE